MAYDELATLIEQILSAETDEARREAFALVDLDQTEVAMTEAANGILTSDDESADTMEALAAIADALDHLRVERAGRLAATTERSDQLAALAARVNGDEPEAETEVEATEAVDGEETLATETTEAAVEETEPDPQPEPEPAVAPRPSLAALRRAAPAEAKPAPEPTSVVTVRASMDVPGFRPGHDFGDMREIAAALIARQEALGKVRGGNISTEKIPVVQFSYMDQLKMVTEDRMMNGLMLMDAGKADALTASGGFCAPSQIVYDFVKVNKPTDLAQDFLPVVGAPRGSIEYPDSPDIRDAFSDNVTRSYSNQDDIDAENKLTAVIACPSFNTCTVGAQYVILQFGNFGTRAYPEWVEHWVGLSMDAHAHKVSEKLISQMVALSSVAVAVGPNAGATSTLISNLAMAAADFRHDLRMGRDAPLDVVLPSWTQDLVQSDMARARKGQPSETLSISDPTIDGWISNLDLNVHYVEDWQDIDGSASTGASTWPLGLDFLLYPPGTFVKLDMGTLDLGVVRDSTLNATNDYNIFVESFESVCKPGIESRLYSVSICANGAFSQDQNLNCSGIDIPSS